MTRALARVNGLVVDKHQGEATTSQLSWYLDELSSYTANLKIYIKKKGKIQEGGLC